MYNKIFHKILDSSIWLEPTPTRIVWITLLAAMDQDGFAHFSAVENLAARARVTLDEARGAVECFLAPDPNSANPANEGRRIERVPGGYVVLNADEHRKTINREIQREGTRLRVAKHRANKRIDNDEDIDKQGTCACCSRPFEKPYSRFVHLDHDHSTGKERGFVCVSCNTVIGQVENGIVCNNKKNANKAMAYIRRFSTSVTALLPSITPVYVSASVSDVVLLPKGLSQKTWDEFKENRIAIKAKMTPNAEARILKRLGRMVDDGENPEEVVGTSIERGWRGLFPVRKDTGKNSAPSKTAQALRTLEGKRR